MTSGRLEGKVALVIGGGQLPGRDTGNGRAVAQLFARHGARVVVVDRNVESAQETADIVAAKGGDARAVRADVTDEADVVAAVRTCHETHGRIDVLHNNVGIGKASGDAPIAELEGAVFDRVMAVNLRGMVLFCRHTLPIMREQHAGSIISISSIAAITNYPTATYRMSKAAVLSLTKHVAATNAEFGIRANAILPGRISTPMAIEPLVGVDGKTYEQVAAERAALIPLGRVGTAWDVANAALFLACDESSFITGAEIVVDGGETLLAGER